MKILLVITGLGVGGAERLVTALADVYAQRGHSVILAYLGGEVALRPTSTMVHLVDLRFSKSLFGIVRGFISLSRLILKFRPDVVSTHLIHANIVGRFVRLFVPIRCLISSAHNNNEGSKIRFMLYRLTDRLADMSTNVSDEAVKAFEVKGAVKPGRMVAIHNGVDTSIFSFDVCARAKIRRELGLNRHDFLALAVGRISKPKDYHNLLEAVKLLENREPRFQLVVAGDGRLRSDIQDEVLRLGLEERVRLLGIRHDVPALMSAADVFVLSSAWEGFGLVVAEAMSCQRLVVATDCGGVREVLGDSGFIVPPQDPCALSKALQKAMYVPERQAVHLGELGRQRVMDCYSLNAAADKWLNFYRRFI